jgi:hypothetical protein
MSGRATLARGRELVAGATGAVEVRIADLVLVRRAGQPLGELTGPLARELAARDVPEAEAAARAIIDRVDRGPR